jgi:hypothetical protein
MAAHDVAGGEAAQYLVALSQSIVQASEDQLAPEYEPGQRVVYHAADRTLVDASVGEMDITHWCVQANIQNPCLC